MKTRNAVSRRTRVASNKGPLKITLQPELEPPARKSAAGIVLQGDDEGAIPRTQGKKRRRGSESAITLRDEEGMVAKRPSRKGPVEESLSLRDDEGSTIKRTSKDGKRGPVKITLQPEPETDPVKLPETLKDLGLSERSRKCLEQAGIRTVNRLTKKEPADLLAIDGLGKSALGEIRRKLQAHGLTLKTDPWEFTPHGDVEALTLHADTERKSGVGLRGDDEGPPSRKRKIGITLQGDDEGPPQRQEKKTRTISLQPDDEGPPRRGERKRKK